jgi:type I restriction enzyme M protein
MLECCRGDVEKEKKVYNSLIGIEANSNMFALACSNMMIRGDGKSNIFYGDCFQLVEDIKKNHKPTAGFLNPPYAKKKADQKELAFVLNNLDMLEPNSLCVAIVPKSCVLSDPLKEAILAKHTLEAVMTMPDNLFHSSASGTVSCIMIVRAHIPHMQSDRKTWFAYWRDDGFEIKRKEGRVDSKNTWATIKEKWLEVYKNRETVSGLSLMKKITAKDEWCIEAYLQTEYAGIGNELFMETSLEYLSFLALNADFKRLNEFIGVQRSKAKTDLSGLSWAPFKIKQLFEVKRGISIPVKDEGLTSGTMVISANTNNNGFSHFVTKPPIYDGNVLSIGSTGQSSVGVAFYQPYPVIATNNVNILEPKFTLNQYTGIFIVSVLKKERYKYSFGRVLGKERTEELEIHLPVNEEAKPDWSFMEKYIKAQPFVSNYK